MDDGQLRGQVRLHSAQEVSVSLRKGTDTFVLTIQMEEVESVVEDQRQARGVALIGRRQN